MRCENCGSFNPDGSKFCSDCGNTLIKEENYSKSYNYQARPYSAKKSKSHLTLIVGLLAIVAIAAVAVFAIGPFNDDSPSFSGSKENPVPSNFSAAQGKYTYTSSWSDDYYNYDSTMIWSFSNGNLVSSSGPTTVKTEKTSVTLTTSVIRVVEPNPSSFSDLYVDGKYESDWIKKINPYLSGYSNSNIVYYLKTNSGTSYSGHVFNASDGSVLYVDDNGVPYRIDKFIDGTKRTFKV